MLNKAEFGKCWFHNKHCKPKVTVLSQERSSSVTQCLRVKGMVGGTIRAPKRGISIRKCQIRACLPEYRIIIIILKLLLLIVSKVMATRN